MIARAASRRPTQRRQRGRECAACALLPLHPDPAAAAIIPYSAVIYEPSGKTYAFANTARLTYVAMPITVQSVSGNSAYLSSGPKAGAKVVSVGAEELYGVQTGVLAQT